MDFLSVKARITESPWEMSLKGMEPVLRKVRLILITVSRLQLVIRIRIVGVAGIAHQVTVEVGGSITALGSASTATNGSAHQA